MKDYTVKLSSNHFQKLTLIIYQFKYKIDTLDILINPTLLITCELNIFIVYIKSVNKFEL